MSIEGHTASNSSAGRQNELRQWSVLFAPFFLAAFALGTYLWWTVEQRVPHTSLRLQGPSRVLPNQSLHTSIAVSDGHTQRPLVNRILEVVLRSPLGKVLQREVGRSDAKGRYVLKMKAPRVVSTQPYELEVSAVSLQAKSQLFHKFWIARSLALRLDTDRLLYRPGDTLRVRVKLLDNESQSPKSGQSIMLSLRDKRGWRLARRELRTKAFGVALAELKLPPHLKEGRYQLEASVGGGQKWLRSLWVRRPPRHGFRLQFPGLARFLSKGHVLSVPVQVSKVSGGPVPKAFVSIKAYAPLHGKQSKHGKWNLFAQSRGQTDARGRFLGHVDPARILAAHQRKYRDGTQMRLSVRVLLPQGQWQSETLLLPWFRQPLSLQWQTKGGGGTLVPGIKNDILLRLRWPDGSPAQAKLVVNGEKRESTAQGVLLYRVKPSGVSFKLKVEAKAGRNTKVSWVRLLPVASSHAAFVLRAARRNWKIGQRLFVEAESPTLEGKLFLVWSRGARVLARKSVRFLRGKAKIFQPLSASWRGPLQLFAYRNDPKTGELLSQTLSFEIKEQGQLKLNTTVDRVSYSPGDTAKVRVQVKGDKGKPAKAMLQVSALPIRGYSAFHQWKRELRREDKAALTTAKHASPLRWRKVSGESFAENQHRTKQRRLESVRSWFFFVLLLSSIPLWLYLLLLVLYALFGQYQTIPEIEQTLDGAQPLSLVDGTAQTQIELMASTYAAVYQYANRLRWSWLACVYGLIGIAIAATFLMPQWFAAGKWPHLGLVWGCAGLGWWLVRKRAQVVIFQGMLVPENTIHGVLMMFPWLFLFVALWATLVLLGYRLFHFVLEGQTLLLMGCNLLLLFLLPSLVGLMFREEPDLASRVRWFFGGMLGSTFAVIPAVAGALALAQFSTLALPVTPGAIRPRPVVASVSQQPGVVVRTALPQKGDTEASWWLSPLLWKPIIKTSHKGLSLFSFPLNEEVKTWRLHVKAEDEKGRVGMSDVTISVFRSFSAKWEALPALRLGEQVETSLAFVNHDKERPSTVAVTIVPRPGLSVTPTKTKVIVPPGASKRLPFLVRAEKRGLQELQAKIKTSGVSDIVVASAKVMPLAPQLKVVGQGVLRAQQKIAFQVPQSAAMSPSEWSLSLFTGPLSVGVEAMARLEAWPARYARLEASRLYASLALESAWSQRKWRDGDAQSFLRKTSQLNFQRLLRFVHRGQGVPWSGGAGNDSMTSALALVALHRYQESVNAAFDETLIDRETQHASGMRALYHALRRQQDKDGRWRHPQALSQKGRGTKAPDDIRTIRDTALFTWALATVEGQLRPTKAGQNKEAIASRQWLLKALTRLEGARMCGHRLVRQAPYLLSLCIHALRAGGKERAAKTLQAILLDLNSRAKDGAYWAPSNMELPATTTRDHRLQTTAWSIAALKNYSKATSLSRLAVRWLLSQRDKRGLWGTPATTALVLSVLPLGEAEEPVRELPPPPAFIVNGRLVKALAVDVPYSRTTQLFRVRRMWKAGAQKILLRHAASTPLLFAWRWRGRLRAAPAPPALTGKAALSFSQRFSPEVGVRGSTLRVTVSLSHSRTDGKRRAIIALPIPKGTRVNEDSLQRLIDKGSLHHFHVAKSELFLFLENLAAGARSKLDFDLHCTQAGRFWLPAGRAFLAREPLRIARTKSRWLIIRGNHP